MKLFRTFIIVLIISIVLLGTYYEENSSISSLNLERFPVDVKEKNPSISEISKPESRLIFRSYGSSFIVRGIAQGRAINHISENISVNYSIKILKECIQNGSFLFVTNMSEKGNGNIFSRNFAFGPGTYEIQYLATINVGNITSNQSKTLNSLISSSLGLIRVIPTSDNILLESGSYILVAALILLIMSNIDLILKKGKNVQEYNKERKKE
jgi:hypothetical protein